MPVSASCLLHQEIRRPMLGPWQGLWSHARELACSHDARLDSLDRRFASQVLAPSPAAPARQPSSQASASSHQQRPIPAKSPCQMAFFGWQLAGSLLAGNFSMLLLLPRQARLLACGACAGVICDEWDPPTTHHSSLLCVFLGPCF